MMFYKFGATGKEAVLFQDMRSTECSVQNVRVEMQIVPVRIASECSFVRIDGLNYELGIKLPFN